MLLAMCATISALYVFVNVLMGFRMAVCGHYIHADECCPPVLSGFVVVGAVWPGSYSRPLVPFGTLRARDDVCNNHLWEISNLHA